MKIRVKKQNQALFENTPATQQPSGQPDTPQVVSDDPAIVESMTELAKGEYLLDKKKLYMNIQMQLPSAFAGPIDLPDAPLDLYNLMQDINTEKFQNVKDVLKDPKKTFDAAPDIAYKAFGDFTGELNFNLKPEKKEKADISTPPIGKDDNATDNQQSANAAPTPKKDDDQEEADKLEQAMQDESTEDTSTGTVADSLVYNYNNPLNESIFGAGAFLGKCFTGVTAGALSGTAGFLSNAAGGIAALFGLGYVGQKAFGDVTGNGGIEDDRVLTAGARATSNKGGKGGYAGADVIGAIDWYLKNIGQSINVVLGRITNAKNGVNIVKDINTFATKTDEEVHTYLKANDEIIRKTRENNEQIIKAERDSAFKDLKQTALNKLTILGFSVQKANSSSEISEVEELYQKVCNFKLKDQEKLTKIANLTGTTLTVENVKKIVTGKNESINISGVKQLNEEEDNFSGDTVNLTKPDVDFDAYYRKIYEHFSNIMVDLFPARAPEDLPGIKAAKEEMNKLKEEAKREITTKIEQVCRVANSGSSNFANNSGMGTKIASFISKHPMKAATLTNLWARHEVDLETRIEMRIEQMTNYGDTTHIMGWAANVCQTVVPEVIARMLTYRYALQLLKNNNVYSYTSLQEQQFNKDWENEDQDAFINNIKTKIKYLLANYGKVLSDDGNTAIATINEKNEFALTGVAIPYTIFLLFNIVKGKNRKFEDSIIGTSGLLINNAAGKENLFIDAFINILTLNKQSNLIFEFNKVEELIKLFDISRKNFEHIKKSYTTITQLAEANKQTLNSDNITNTISLLYSTNSTNVPWIKSYIENKDEWTNIINEYLKDTTNAENKSKVKKLIKGYEKASDISTMVVNPELFMATTPYDYYSNIICIYKALGLNMVTEYGEKYKSEIVNICNITEAISKLIITNALLFNTVSTKDESDFKQIIKLYQNMKQNRDENSVVEFLENLDDGLSNDFDFEELSEVLKDKDIYADDTVGIIPNLEKNIKNIIDLDEITNIEIPVNLDGIVDTLETSVEGVKTLTDLLNIEKIDEMEFIDDSINETTVKEFKEILRYAFEFTIADIQARTEDDVKISEINLKLIDDLWLVSTIYSKYFSGDAYANVIAELKTEFNDLYNKCADEFIAYIENYKDINSIDTFANKIIDTLNFNSLNEILNSEITTVEELNNKLIELFKKYDITNVGVKQLVNKYIDCINTLYNEKETKWQSFNKLITCIKEVTKTQNEQ